MVNKELTLSQKVAGFALQGGRDEETTLEEVIAGLVFLGEMYGAGFMGLPDQMERMESFNQFVNSQNYPQDYYDDLSKIAPANLIDAFRPLAKCIGHILVAHDILGTYGNADFKTDASIILGKRQFKPLYNPGGVKW